MDLFRFDIVKTFKKTFPSAGEKRVIAGFASSEGLNKREKSLLFNSLNYEYLKAGNGRLNWDKSYDIIIGEPSFVQADEEKGLYIECVLYERTPDLNISSSTMNKALDLSEKAWNLANNNTPLEFLFSGNRGMNFPSPQIVLTNLSLREKIIDQSPSLVGFAKSLLDESQFRELNIDELSQVNDASSLIKYLKKFDFKPEETVQLVKTIKEKILS